VLLSDAETAQQVQQCVHSAAPLAQVEAMEKQWVKDVQRSPTSLPLNAGKMFDPTLASVVKKWIGEAANIVSGAKPSPALIQIAHCAVMLLAHSGYQVLTPQGSQDEATKQWFIGTVRRFIQEKSDVGVSIWE